MTIPMPVEVHEIDLAFPARALEIMPKWEDIPEDFRQGTGDAAPWHDLQRTWFSYGLHHEYFAFVPLMVDGKRLEGEKIMRHLTVIQGSYAPKHEHKMAAFAYLASLWMECVSYCKPDGELDDIKVAGALSREDWIAHFSGTDLPEDEEVEE